MIEKTIYIAEDGTQFNFEEDYTTYQLFLGAVLDEVNMTYTEMEAGA